jgi:Mitochondrial small ribosomal subunit Rsm22
LAKTPSRIHRGLVGQRELVGTTYLADTGLRREYESEIAPRTVAALEWIFGRQTLPAPRRVLDMGAGTGAASSVIRTRWPQAGVVSVDRVAGPGIVRADVTRGLRPAGVVGTFDLLVAAHLLNELPLDLDGRARLVLGWCRELLADEGAVVLVEPALRETSRALLGVRDRLIAAGLFVEAPCLWQGPCPALVRDRDFCHASANALVRGRSRVDFGYLVVRKHGAALADSALFRIVSDAMKDKGRLRRFGCGPAGRLLITRLDRDRGPGNEAFDEVDRGDVIRIVGATAQSDGLRCGRDCTVGKT